MLTLDRTALALALTSCAAEPLVCAGTCPDVNEPIAWTAYHGEDRLGWNDRERELVADELRGRGLTLRWSSPAFETRMIDGVAYAPHLYASPLWLDGVALRAGPFAGARAGLAVAATSNGHVYAVVAADAECDACSLGAGELAWTADLVKPQPLSRLDGGMPMGVLSTPVVDLAADPPRLYVTAMDRARGWLTFALDLSTGRVLRGWPLAISDATLAGLNTNGPATMRPADVVSQRGALQLSPSGDRLYIPFATYQGEGVGWLVAVDTQRPALIAAFSSAPWSEPRSNGGIWGSAGPAIADDGSIWLTTGNSPPGSGPTVGTWGNSLLRLDPDLVLQASYTPWNYCSLDEANMDLSGSQPLLLPPLPATSTPLTVAFGGKQGNVYLVDRSALAEGRDRRPPCGDDPAADTSLLPPEPQPHLGARGPLSVFGPYSEVYGQLDYAKMRSRLAYLRDDAGVWLFAAGSTKAAEDSQESVPPSLARLRVVTPPGAPAYLEIAATNLDIAFVNPGTPVVSSDGVRGAIVWVLDENAPRVASLLDPATPRPVLYAFDADNLELLWRTEPDALALGGKYGAPVVAHGVVVVATDRLSAFGLPR